MIKHFLLLLLSIFVFAQPNPQVMAGDFSHDGIITIYGNGFGVKNPAKPLWWDNGECVDADTNDPSIMTTGEIEHIISTLTGSNKHYNDVWPASLSNDSLEMQYHTYNTGYMVGRGVDRAHARGDRFLGGGHDDEGECAGGEVGQNVAINISNGSASEKWFVDFYLRLDPAFPSVISGHNYKGFDWEETSPYTIYYGPTNKYEAINDCDGNNGLRTSALCKENWYTFTQWQILDTNCGDSGDWYKPVITYDTTTGNPANEWVKETRLLQTTSGDQFFHLLCNNKYIANTDLDLEDDCSLTVTGNVVGGVTLGGYWRYQFCGGSQDDLDDDARRYFDDVYVDTTFYRVMLGDNQTYTSCTILEPQIPFYWKDEMIQIRLNFGALTDEQDKYLFIFKGDNTRNSNGKLLAAADTNFIGGYYYTSEDDFDSTAPLAHSYVWKSFSFIAETTLTVSHFGMRLASFAGSPETNNDLGFAVFRMNTTTDSTGVRMFSGFEDNYDWTVIGTGAYHRFEVDTIYTTATLQKDSAYFITFEASGCENILIPRGRAEHADPDPNATKRWMTNQDTFTDFSSPPDSSDMINSLNDGFYAWFLEDITEDIIMSITRKMAPGNAKIAPGKSKVY